MVDQVLVNLLSNAAKYAPDTEVTVSLRDDGGAALLTVEDTGAGIPQDAQERIFQRFERAVESRNVTGFGLGLWIVREIVDAHQGQVWVDSEPGRGSRFNVRIPLVLEAARAAAPESGSKGLLRSAGR